MSQPSETRDDRSVGDLLRNVATDARALIQGEIALARTETGETLHRLTSSLVAVVGGTLIAFAGLIVLLFALVDVLTRYMPYWGAAVLVGGVVAIIGAILVQRGAKTLRPDGLIPRRAVGNVAKDIDMVKERVT